MTLEHVRCAGPTITVDVYFPRRTMVQMEGVFLEDYPNGCEWTCSNLTLDSDTQCISFLIPNIEVVTSIDPLDLGISRFWVHGQEYADTPEYRMRVNASVSRGILRILCAAKRVVCMPSKS